MWTPQGDPLQIFDERLHPLHAGAAPGRACATPSVSAVANWIRSLATTARMGPEASVVGLAYVERFVCCAGVALEAHTWMRVVAAAWLLAAKMWDDDCLENPEFADAFCLDADDLYASGVLGRLAPAVRDVPSRGRGSLYRKRCCLVALGKADARAGHEQGKC